MQNSKPWLKPLLEFGPLVLFFGVFMLYRDDTVVIAGREYGGFILATLVFIPALLLASLVQWRVNGRLQPMQIATLVLVLVFGGLSIWLNDPRFFKMKPTLIYLLFGAILGMSLLLRRNWLGAVLSEALPMDNEGWRKLTLRMALFFLALAVANEAIWRNFSDETWVWFKTFGLPILLFAFLMGNAGLYRAHALPDKRD
ncbi:inner membrane-spanning protein YciB [Paracoccus sp. 1_MG-2023]|uniref:inner membrane-spanning protein YciB n=1 Tax=unclassified Paracoccus (in: a-proteobacteria) TaxID=2688777 RepID=UPI001C082E50|nr:MULTISPECIES: inner membrane-spanning protein YciB [unclassified Paracoccus (in: a-proteobacteria)]MBU2959017.1 septation protein IspZ [Paracoccus sp. C2R09]MDO6668989.1 inner membrane-spanning protein YciB [Paracoccus sp. 1_MG-2023]